mmetsp:Transcript_28776/g.66438  ORF Transcript_28776/g.66438 Transcript_28776/m.66438 type:complete len:207 (+) Transcript_28776:849-1469(+)
MAVSRSRLSMASRRPTRRVQSQFSASPRQRAACSVGLEGVRAPRHTTQGHHKMVFTHWTRSNPRRTRSFGVVHCAGEGGTWCRQARARVPSVCHERARRSVERRRRGPRQRDLHSVLHCVDPWAAFDIGDFARCGSFVRVPGPASRPPRRAHQRQSVCRQRPQTRCRRLCPGFNWTDLVCESECRRRRCPMQRVAVLGWKWTLAPR